MDEPNIFFPVALPLRKVRHPDKSKTKSANGSVQKNLPNVFLLVAQKHLAISPSRLSVMEFGLAKVYINPVTIPLLCLMDTPNILSNHRLMIGPTLEVNETSIKLLVQHAKKSWVAIVKTGNTNQCRQKPIP
jgi:hypothetical protein